MKRRSLFNALRSSLSAFIFQKFGNLLERNCQVQPIQGQAKSLTIQATRPEDSVNIREFGALGDGISNDTRAINDAIKFLARERNGGTIWFPKGRYWIDPSSLKGSPQQFFSQFSNITFAGIGSNDSEWLINPYFSSPNQRLFYHEKQSGCANWTFQDLHINSQGLLLPESTECFRDKLIKVFVRGFRVNRCTFSNEPGRGLFTVLGDHQHFEDCDFHRVGCRATDSSVIHPGNILHHANHIAIINCRSYSDNVNKNRFNRTTFYDAQASNVLIKGCKVRGGKKGLILALGKEHNSNILVSGCEFSVHHHCVHIYPSRNVKEHSSLSSLLVQECSLEAYIPLSFEGLPASQVSDVVICKCMIRSTGLLLGHWLKMRFVRNLLLTDVTINRGGRSCFSIDELYLTAQSKRVVR